MVCVNSKYLNNHYFQLGCEFLVVLIAYTSALEMLHLSNVLITDNTKYHCFEYQNKLSVIETFNNCVIN